MQQGGYKLRNMRQKLGLTLRDVEAASERIAAKYCSDEYALPISRLSDFENKHLVPSIQRLYSLTLILRCDFFELLSWYGIASDDLASDSQAIQVQSSRPSRRRKNRDIALPQNADTVLDPTRTRSFRQMVEQWGAVPFAYLEQLSKGKFTYGYIGTEDLTMYPILSPGSFVQVDESRNRIQEVFWRSEYERPIYFVETREEHVCSWCSLRSGDLIVESHPRSPVPSRVFAATEAEVIGQVVGVAMRLGEWRSVYEAAQSARMSE
jgi:transcriptional regulator with XRE-family HTH domain